MQFVSYFHAPARMLISLLDKGKRRRSSSSAAEAVTQSMDGTAVKTLVEVLLETRLTAHKREVVELLSAHEAKVEELLAAYKAEFTDKLDSLEERIRNNVMDGLTEFIDVQVLEKMQEVRDDVMDQITSMPLQANLTFPDHPFY